MHFLHLYLLTRSLTVDRMADCTAPVVELTLTLSVILILILTLLVCVSVN